MSLDPFPAEDILLESIRRLKAGFMELEEGSDHAVAWGHYDRAAGLLAALDIDLDKLGDEVVR